MQVRWNREKSELLLKERNISLDEIALVIKSGEILDDIPNPYPSRKGQGLFVIDLDGYALIIPYISENDGVFLKTAYFSRKFTRIYLE